MATLNAPHAYLFRNESDNYILCIGIPHAPGHKVVLSSSDPITFPIKFSVEGGGDGTTAYYYHVFNLGKKNSIDERRTNMVTNGPVRDIVDSAANEDGNVEETISIEVQNNIDTNNKSACQTVLMLDDVLAQPNIVLSDNKARFCPYLYLSNPSAETGGEENNFTPSLIIPLNNQITEDVEIELSPGEEFQMNKSYMSIINFGNDDTINGAADTQPTTSAVNGNNSFIATINRNGATKRIKMRTRSSDTKPNSFLSDKQMELKKGWKVGRILPPNPEPEHKSLFQRIWNWIKRLFIKTDNLKGLFYFTMPDGK